MNNLSSVLAGTNAQKNGAAFEKLVSNLSDIYGFKTINFKEYKRCYRRYEAFKKLIVTQPVCLDYFKRKKTGRQDMLIRIENHKETFSSSYFEVTKNSGRNPLLEVCVQCKSQMTKGSVDEKIAAFVLNLLYNKIEQKNVIFLHIGKGIRDCFTDALEELSVELKRKETYNLKVMNLLEFNSWIKETV